MSGLLSQDKKVVISILCQRVIFFEAVSGGFPEQSQAVPFEAEETSRRPPSGVVAGFIV